MKRFWMATILATFLLTCWSMTYAAADAQEINVKISMLNDTFTVPEDTELTIRVRNTSDRILGPISLYQSSGQIVESFILSSLTPSECYEWTGAWHISQEAIASGKVYFEFRLQDQNGQPKTLRCFKPININTTDTEPQAASSVEQTIDTLLRASWMPQNVEPMIVDNDSSDSYYTVKLVQKHTGEAAGVIQIDVAANHVLYYRAEGYEMPKWPNSDTLWGSSLDREARRAWESLQDKWNKWAQQALSVFSTDHAIRIPYAFHAEDPTVVMYTVCETSHGDLTAVMICRIPERENDTPEVLAYVNVRTNPNVGYDGYLTAHQAEEAARAYIRKLYGQDAANRLICESQDMIIYDYPLYFQEEMDDPESFESACSPMWAVLLHDPLYDWDNMDIDYDAPDWDEQAFAEAHDETYEYSLMIDARTGEILEACEDSYGNG